MQNTGNHPEEVQLLGVIQTNLLHGHAHPVEVALVVKKRVSERANLQMLPDERVGIRRETGKM